MLKYSTDYRKRDFSARDQAIRTIENEYLVVGLTDDLPAFFEVMEAIYPKIFRDSREAFLRSGTVGRIVF